MKSEFKKQTSIAEKQYQELDNIHGLSKTILNRNRENSDLVYNNFKFNKFNITDEEFNDLSDDKKYNYLQKFFKRINELRKVKSRTVNTKTTKKC